MAPPLRPRSPSDASSAPSLRDAGSGNAAQHQGGRQAPTQTLVGEPSPNERAVAALAQKAVRNQPVSDLLETVPSGTFTATKALQDVHLDPLVRGTRGVDGSTGAGAVMGHAKDHNDSFKVTPFGLHASSVQADGTTVSMSADRQSAFATATIPNGDGSSTSATAGPLAGMLYGAVSANDGNGNSFGGFVVGLRNGTPGVGGSYAHTSSLGAVAISPSGIADKTESTTVVESSNPNSKDPAARKAKVTTVQSLSGLAQVVLSAGSHGIAVVARLAADAASTKTYTETLPLDEAKKLRKNESMLGQRLKGLNVGKRGRKLPKLSRPQDFSPGAKMTHEVQTNYAASAGLSAGGVQALFGRIKTHKTKAEVARPLATQDKPSPKNTVVLTRETATNDLVAMDFPLLLSGVGGRHTISQESVEYAFDSDDTQGPEDLLKREPTKFFGKGHFVGGDKVDLPSPIINNQVLWPAHAKEALKKLQDNNGAVNKFTAAQMRGGMGWRLAVLPLPAAWLGPLAALSYTRETNVAVGFVQADAELAMVSSGLQHRSQYELPGIGRVAMEVELLSTTSSKNGAGSSEAGESVGLVATNKEGTILKFKESFSHVHANTLKDVDKQLRKMLPSKLTGVKAAPRSLELELSMNLEVYVQVELTPAVLRKAADNSPLFASLGPVPNDQAGGAKLLAYHKAALVVVNKVLKSVDRNKIQQLVRSFDDAGATSTLEVQSDAFAKTKQAAADVQVKFAPKAVNTADNKKRADLFARVVEPAADVARKLDQVWDLSHQSPLVFVPQATQMERKASLRDVGFGLAQLVTGNQNPNMLGLMSTQAPSSVKPLLETLLATSELKSPAVATSGATNPFDAGFAAAEVLPPR